MAAQPLFALIDCNNFFASCEQVFRPALAGKPLIVLSSNDGCVIARSAEARAVGIPMGAPAFKWREKFKEHDVLQFSANFELYGDISRRITEILTSITPRLEVYSIDESFLDISQLDIKDYTKWATALKETIMQWVGIPVSIGIAPSKTLAKLASERAKRDPSLNNVVYLDSRDTARDYLGKSPVEDIWGVGRKFGPRLRAVGIATALDVANLMPTQGRRLLGSVNGERLVRELNGECCFPLERTHTDQKMISVSRTFGKDADQQHVVESALASFVARASQSLRVSKRTTTRLQLFATTSRHKPNYRSWYREIQLDQPTADSGKLIGLTCQLFNEIYQPNTLYHRAGIILSGFTSDAVLQTDLLGYRDVQTFDQSKQRMQAVDELHARYGKPALYYGTEKLARSWQPLSEIRSPHYTTSWDDLPKVRQAQRRASALGLQLRD